MHKHNSNSKRERVRNWRNLGKIPMHHGVQNKTFLQLSLTLHRVQEQERKLPNSLTYDLSSKRRNSKFEQMFKCQAKTPAKIFKAKSLSKKKITYSHSVRKFTPKVPKILKISFEFSRQKLYIQGQI